MAGRFSAMLWALLIFGSPAFVHAQAVKGALLGNITDEGGLAIP